MPISRNNFTSLPVEAEQEGVDVSFFTVDFINGLPVHELKFGDRKVEGSYLRVGRDTKGIGANRR